MVTAVILGAAGESDASFIFIFEVVVWVFPCFRLRVDEVCHYYSSRATTAIYSSLYLMLVRRVTVFLFLDLKGRVRACRYVRKYTSSAVPRSLGGSWKTRRRAA